MSVYRECCNHCMWLGPVNEDGSMRKHYRASDDVFGSRKQVKELGICPGSNKPYARFGTEAEATEDAPQPTEETATVTSCPAHDVPDERGAHVEALPVPRCQDGTTYGVWDELAGGFTYAADCALEAANWAAEQLDEDPDGEMYIKAVCREHEEQPADTCEDCFAEDEDSEDDEQDDEDA